MSRLLAIGLSILAVAYLTNRLPLLQQPVEAEVAAARNLSPEVQRALSFGFKQVLSDAYWLQAVQYYGTKANEDVFYRGLYAILDRATTLDPHFEFAYQFGGEVIPYHQGEVGWHNTAKAIALLQKGMANQPGRWEIPFLLAYALFTYTGDYQQAGHYMEIAADLAERGQRKDERFAPPTYLRSLGARLLAQGGALETAIELTRGAAERASDEKQKAEYLDRLRSLELERDLTQLNEGLKTRRTQGLETSSMADLAGYVGETTAPVDPFGDPYLLDTANGQVVSKNQSRLLRLYVHPKQNAAGEQAVD